MVALKFLFDMIDIANISFDGVDVDLAGLDAPGPLSWHLLNSYDDVCFGCTSTIMLVYGSIICYEILIHVLLAF
ncbi:hypothetical protein OSB04_022281 [Centaurea solstitialis]|uniref:Uncharacterized protein n=1 Tax=Centaurea solstitialis TaxID=347529 RepID=A0AA38T3L9_9ASTR|nr:hypothetical protein OSB04_022281 [Centaurea solstitialis]